MEQKSITSQTGWSSSVSSPSKQSSNPKLRTTSCVRVKRTGVLDKIKSNWIPYFLSCTQAAVQNPVQRHGRGSGNFQDRLNPNVWAKWIQSSSFSNSLRHFDASLASGVQVSGFRIDGLTGNEAKRLREILAILQYPICQRRLCKHIK